MKAKALIESPVGRDEFDLVVRDSNDYRTDAYVLRNKVVGTVARDLAAQAISRAYPEARVKPSAASVLRVTLGGKTVRMVFNANSLRVQVDDLDVTLVNNRVGSTDSGGGRGPLIAMAMAVLAHGLGPVEALSLDLARGLARVKTKRGLGGADPLTDLIHARSRRRPAQ